MERPWFLHPDISCGYSVNGRPLLDAAQLLAGRRPAVGSNGDPKGVMVPAPASEFIYYLLKKIEKQALNERHARHLSSTYREDPAGAAAQLRRFWHDADVERIARAGACGDWSAVRTVLPRLRRELRHARPIPWVARLREVGRVFDRIRRRTGFGSSSWGPMEAARARSWTGLPTKLRRRFDGPGSSICERSY